MHHIGNMTAIDFDCDYDGFVSEEEFFSRGMCYHDMLNDMISNDTHPMVVDMVEAGIGGKPLFFYCSAVIMRYFFITTWMSVFFTGR